MMSPKEQLINKIGILIKKDGSIFFENKLDAIKSTIVIKGKIRNQTIPIWYGKTGNVSFKHILDCCSEPPINYIENRNTIIINLYNK